MFPICGSLPQSEDENSFIKDEFHVVRVNSEQIPGKPGIVVEFIK